MTLLCKQHVVVLQLCCVAYCQSGTVTAWHLVQKTVFCRHIVASQVYGEKVQSKKPADRWLAKSVEFLMQSYPSMRIAYIDNVGKDSSGKGTPMSVLLRWDEGVHQFVVVPLSPQASWCCALSRALGWEPLQ